MNELDGAWRMLSQGVSAEVCFESLVVMRMVIMMTSFSLPSKGVKLIPLIGGSHSFLFLSPVAEPNSHHFGLHFKSFG